MSSIRAVIDQSRENEAGGSKPRFQASWHGVVLAESDRTVAIEGNRYFPPQDVSFEHLEPSSRETVCPWKGTASYYDVVVGGDRNAGAAWYYPQPSAAAAEIQGHVAFWQGVNVAPLRGREWPA